MNRTRRVIERVWSRMLIRSLNRDLATAECDHETVNIRCRICVLLAMAGGVVPHPLPRVD
jgi:hypothetical protein